GNAASLYPLAGMMPKLTNRMMKTPVGKELFYQFFNIHKKRNLPSFASQTFRKWFKKRSSDRRVRDRTSKSKDSDIHLTATSAVGRKAALLIDPFINYHDPEIGKAAVVVLETLGYKVIIPDVSETGRPQLSKGMVKKAK